MRSSRIIFTLFISLLLSSSLFANGLSLNSIGTKATGMGGAFVGLANDYTAIYWNPAGLSGQNSGVMVFATDIIPFASYKFDAYGVNAETKTNHYLGPNLFANYNMGDLSLGLGLYVPAGLGAEWSGTDLVAFSGPENMPDGPNSSYGNVFKWRSEIGVFSISPTVSYQITEQFSAGLAINIYYGMMDLERAMDVANLDTLDLAQDGPNDNVVDKQYEETGSGLGYGFTLGLKYDVSEMISLGATFRSQSTISFEGTAKNSAFIPAGAEETDYERDISWPVWVGVGVALRPMEALTITADAQYSQWSETGEEIETDYKNPVWKAMLGAEGGKMVMNWEDAIQYRLGMQYCASKDLAVRAGYYYDPAPAPDETVNILFPSSTNQALTAGLTYNLNPISIIVAGEYLFGEEREIEASALGNNPGVHQMDIAAFSVGINYFF